MRTMIAAPVLALTVLLAAPSAPLLAQDSCSQATITAYSIEQFPGTTADGTRTSGNAGVIAAASYNYPLGATITIEGLGAYRVADRGHLGANHIDILVQSTREALNFGRQTRIVCH